MPRRVHFNDVGVKINDPSFDARTLAMLNDVLREAWRHVRPEKSSPLEALAIQVHIVTELIEAARNGERDPTQLRSIALQGRPMKPPH